MSEFVTLSDCELEQINGGVIGWVIVGCITAAGCFAAGYGLAYWLG